MGPDKKKKKAVVFTPQAEKNFIKYMETVTYTNVSDYPYGLGKEWEK